MGENKKASWKTFPLSYIAFHIRILFSTNYSLNRSIDWSICTNL